MENDQCTGLDQYFDAIIALLSVTCLFEEHRQLNRIVSPIKYRFYFRRKKNGQQFHSQ